MLLILKVVHIGHDLMNPKQRVRAAFVKQNKIENINYRVCVTTFLIVFKYRLRCGLPFRGSHEAHAKFDEENIDKCSKVTYFMC